MSVLQVLQKLVCGRCSKACVLQVFKSLCVAGVAKACVLQVLQKLVCCKCCKSLCVAGVAKACVLQVLQKFVCCRCCKSLCVAGVAKAAGEADRRRTLCPGGDPVRGGTKKQTQVYFCIFKAIAVCRIRIRMFWAFWIRIHQFKVRIRIRILLLSSKNNKKNLSYYFFCDVFMTFYL